MNASNELTFDWRTDLLASRDLNSPEKRGFTILLEWFETWRINRSLQPSLETSRNFWKAQVLSKPREPWQKDQWAQAIRWYLKWLSSFGVTERLLTRRHPADSEPQRKTGNEVLTTDDTDSHRYSHEKASVKIRAIRG